MGDLLALVLPSTLSAIVAGAAAYLAVRIELAVMKTRLDAMAQEQERQRGRLDSMFRMKTGGAPLGDR